MLADLAKLKRDLGLETPPVPKHLRSRLTESIQARYSANRSIANSQSWPERILIKWNALSKWSYRGAAAATGLISLAVYFSVTYWSNTTSIDEDDDGDSVEMAVYEVQAARDDYLRAIDNLEDLAADRLGQLPDEIAVVYEENIEIINRAIRECEEAIDTNPGNALAYASLDHAYQARIGLLIQIIDS